MEDYRRLEDTRKQNYEKQEAYLRAKKKVKKIVGFYWHLASYIVVNLFIVGVIVYTSDNWHGVWHFGTLSTPLFWGIGLGFHALNVWGPDLMFGKKWEQRKIKSYMEKYGDEQKRYE